MIVLGLIGANALLFFFVWLGCAIAASYLSGRKGYGERIGLASGLILTVIGVVVWLVWPPRPDSDWKVKGAFGSRAGQGPGEADPGTGRRTEGPGDSTGARA